MAGVLEDSWRSAGLHSGVGILKSSGVDKLASKTVGKQLRATFPSPNVLLPKGCHQEVWPRFMVGLLASNNLI